MCLYSKYGLNKKFVKNGKNKGIIPIVWDDRTRFVPIGCGNCMECRNRKARDWKVRLCEEIRESTNAKFITLTFSNEWYSDLCDEFNSWGGYQLDNAVAALAVRRFTERYRKAAEDGKALRHWLITELGHEGTENIHLHGIIWTDKTMDEIEKLWKYGWIWKGKKQRYTKVLQNYVSERTVNYMMKYVTKMDKDHPNFKSRILCSKGIGAGYINRRDAERNVYNINGTNEVYVTRQGKRIALPIYYRNKIYNEDEREQLWIEKLNEEVRYVGGEKVDISKGIEEFDKLTMYYRKINEDLGYGSNVVDDEAKMYELQRRYIMQETRRNKGKE